MEAYMATRYLIDIMDQIPFHVLNIDQFYCWLPMNYWRRLVGKEIDHLWMRVWYLINTWLGCSSSMTTHGHSPPFCPPVLEPCLDLSVGHFQGFGEGGSLCRSQVFLAMKSLLQFADLDSGERRPRFFTLGRSPILIRVSDPAGHCEGGQGCSS